MARFLIVCVFAMAATVAAADQDSSVQGVVVNSLTGEPIGRAYLMLVPMKGKDGGQAVTASRLGTFDISRIPPGQYHLSASKPGYFAEGPQTRIAADGRSTNFPAGLVVDLGAGEKLDSLSLRLTPLGVVTGLVTDEEGEPLRGVSVSLDRAVWRDGQRTSNYEHAITNDRGEFRAVDLMPGRYYVSFFYEPRRPRLASLAQKNEEGYPSVYFPGVSGIENALPIDLPVGGVRAGVDVKLTRSKVYRVSGQLKGLNTAAENEMFSLSIDSGSAPHSIDLGPNNSFVFKGVFPGHHTLQASFAHSYAQVSVEVADRDVGNVSVPIHPRFSVNGHFRWEGDPSVGASKPRLTVVPLRMGSLGFAEDAKTNDDGSFTIPDLVPWKMMVRIEGIGEKDYLKSVRFGDAVIDNGVFDAAPGVELEIELKRGAGTIEGDVKQGDKRRAGASVVLIHKKYRNWPAFNKTVASDQTGHFSFAGLAPGEYELYAFDSIEEGAWYDPGFTQKYGALGERITVEEKGQVARALTLIEEK